MAVPFSRGGRFTVGGGPLTLSGDMYLVSPPLHEALLEVPPVASCELVLVDSLELLLRP